MHTHTLNGVFTLNTFLRWDCCCCRFVLLEFFNCTHSLCTHHILFFCLFGHFHLFSQISTYHIDITLHIVFSVFHSTQRGYEMRLMIPNRLTLYLFLFCWYFNFHFDFIFAIEINDSMPEKKTTKEKPFPWKLIFCSNFFFLLQATQRPLFLSAFFSTRVFACCSLWWLHFSHSAYARVCMRASLLAREKERMGEQASERVAKRLSSLYVVLRNVLSKYRLGKSVK